MFRRLFLFFAVLAASSIATFPLRAADDDNSSTNKQSEFYRSVPNVKPKSREVYFYEMRNFPSGRIPQNARAKALDYVENAMMATARKNAPHVMAAQPAWRAIGPFNVGGRVRSVVVHPTNPAKVWIGTAAGGAWQTENSGATWKPIFDNQNASAFGSLAVDPNDPDVLWAATGEIEASVDAYLGNGVYKSVDGGETWEHIGLAHIGAFSKIHVHPLNSNFVVAGAVKNGAGFYKTTDGGKTWKKTFDGPVSDVSINPQSENDVFIGVTGEGVYYSGDGGETFDFLPNGFPQYNVGRVSVQAAKSNANIVYCLIARYEYTSETDRTEYADIYQSTNRGQQWNKVYSGTPSFFNNQGFYNHYIEVHPTNPSIAFAGGIDIFRTLDGKQWNNVTYAYSGGNTHPDQQAIAFAPSSPQTIYAGNDGGMYISKDGGTSWTAINTGLAITQFYKMGVDQKNSAATYGGSQDNGTHGSPNGAPNWSAIGGGDGGYVSVDPKNSNLIYGSFQQGVMWKLNLATSQQEILGLPAKEVDAPLFIAPHLIDPKNSSFLYHGRKHLYVSSDAGRTWDQFNTLPALEGSISAIGASRAQDFNLYIGTSRGEVYTTLDGDTWEQANNGLPKRFITDILPSWKDPSTAYLSLSGFGTGHVFKTTDGGKTWFDISNGLPDIPCGSIVFSPKDENILFAGTDIGVFATFDGGATWLPFGTGLPRTHIADLEFHVETNTLRAATHGRSMWEVDVPSTTIDVAGITSPAGGESYNALSTQVISWYGISGSVKVEYSVDDGDSWKTITTAAVGSHVRWKIPDLPTIVGRIRITPNDNPEAPLISRTFAINKFAPGSVLAQTSVPHIAYGIAYDGKGGLWTTSFYGNKIYKLNATTFQIESSFTIPGGDSLYTDITIDKTTQTLYVHKLNRSVNPNGGKILVLNTDGQLLRTMDSPGKKYPIGLAWVQGKLLAGDRDTRKLYWVNPQTGDAEGDYNNPFQKNSGPRGMCYDGATYCYQASTDFSGQTLQAAFSLQFAADNPSQEVGRLPLRTATATINARGIDYDATDKTFWISDFDGNIFKTAGFEVVTNIAESKTRIDKDVLTVQQAIPNPFSENTSIAFTLRTASPVRVDVYNAVGSRLLTLHDAPMAAGTHSLAFQGKSLASGVYTLVFSINGVPVASQNAILLR